MPCVCRSYRGVHDQRLCFCCHQQREREIGEQYKTQQRQNTPEDKALFEAASRIIKLGERENLTLDKAAECAASPKPTHKGRQKDLASRLIEHQRKQSNSGSAESSLAAPPAIDTIADEEEDSDDEEFRSA
jgi:hypothetical protein